MWINYSVPGAWNFQELQLLNLENPTTGSSFTLSESITRKCWLEFEKALNLKGKANCNLNLIVPCSNSNKYAMTLEIHNFLQTASIQLVNSIAMHGAWLQIDQAFNKLNSIWIKHNYISDNHTIQYMHHDFWLIKL